MIFWIASYPKSGNTYLRSFLSSYYFSNDGKFDFNLLLNINQFPSLRYSDIKSYTYVEAAKNWIKNQNKFETIIFSDDEFSSFLTGLISDL